MEIIITNHAKERVKERCGIKKSSAERYARLAFDRGKTREAFTGSIKKWLDKIYLPEGGGNVYVFADKAFIFAEQQETAFLITALRIPTKLAKHAKTN